MTQDGDTELLYYPAVEPDSVSYGAKLRLTAHGKSCRQTSGQTVLLHLIQESLTHIWNSMNDIRWIITVMFMRTTNIPPPHYTRRTHQYPPCLVQEKARHRRAHSYQTLSPNKLKTKILVVNSISPPRLKPSNNSLMLQTSTTLQNHCQVKTTIILFLEMTR